MIKIVFLGTPDYIEPIIEVLNKNFELLKTVRNPQQLDSKEIEQLKDLKPDLFVVASFGKIFTKDFLAIPKYGVLNIHPSLLPKYRGPTPVQTAILNGGEKTGVTIIKMDEEVDHGPILAQEEVEIDENETSKTLLDKTFKLGAKMLPKIISKYIANKLNPSPQDDSKATYTEHLTRKSGYIDLSKEFKIERAVRAYYPWPGVWFRTKLGEQNRMVKLLPDKKIQVEGKNPMNYKDFINGYSEGKDVLSKLGLLEVV